MEKRFGRRGLMRENAPLVTDEVFGYALVTYLKENWREAAQLMAAFCLKGIRYRENPLSIEALSESSYTDTVLPLLEKCSHYVSVYSQKLIPPREKGAEADGDTAVLRNHFWYQVGYLSSFHTSAALAGDEESFFLTVAFPGAGGCTLGGTPMEDANIRTVVSDSADPSGSTPLMIAERLIEENPLLLSADLYGGRRLLSEQKTAEALFAAFLDRLPEAPPEEGVSGFVTATLRALSHEYFSKTPEAEERILLESEAEGRIGYHRVTVSLSVSAAAYRRACRYLGDGQGRLDRDLGEYIRCGARIFAFGKNNQATAREIPLLPYVRERTSGGSFDFPPEIYRSAAPELQGPHIRMGRGRSFREYRFALLLPVHSLFGVCFKPYLYFSGIGAPVEMLGAMFAPALSRRNDPVLDREAQRLWFSLGLHENATELSDETAPWGHRRDVIYPQ